MIPRIAIDVIYSMLPELILSSIVLITLRLVYLYNEKKAFVLYKELFSLVFVIYVLLLFELVTTTDYYAYGNNFIPFKEIFRYTTMSSLFYRNVIGNVALFMPFGYFVSYYCKINKFYLTVGISFIISFVMETIQACIDRAFDIDDIILNMLGGLFGYLIFKVVEKLFRRYPEKYKNNILLNFICIIIIFILVFMILGLYGVI